MWGNSKLGGNGKLAMARNGIFEKGGDGSNGKHGRLDSSRCRKEWSDGGDWREKMMASWIVGFKFWIVEEHAPLWSCGSHSAFTFTHRTIVVVLIVLYYWRYEWYLWLALNCCSISSLSHCPHTLPLCQERLHLPHPIINIFFFLLKKV